MANGNGGFDQPNTAVAQGTMNLPGAIPQQAQQYASAYQSGDLMNQVAQAQSQNPAWANLQATQANIAGIPGQYQQMLGQQMMNQAMAGQASQQQMAASMAQQGLGGLAGTADLAGLGLQQQLAQQQAQIANQQGMQDAQGAAIAKQQEIQEAQVKQDSYVGDEMKEMMADVVSQLFSTHPTAEGLSGAFEKDLNAFSNILMGAVQLYYATNGQQGMPMQSAEQLMYTYPQFWKEETGEKVFWTGPEEEKGVLEEAWDWVF